MNRKTTLIILACLISFSAISQTNKKPLAKKTSVETTSTTLNSPLDSVSYAFGYNISQDLKARGFKNLNYTIIANAMADGFQDKSAVMNKDQSQKVIVAALANATKEKYAPILAEGQKYLDENKKKAGVTTLASGLQYEVLQAATGDKPKATDQVTVHYKGTLINGTQFDSSYDRKEPTSFALNGVIPGWTEGLQLMSVGAKYRFVIPYQLAYGERGAGEGIPPYSVLIFEVELIKIGK